MKNEFLDFKNWEKEFMQFLESYIKFLKQSLRFFWISFKLGSVFALRCLSLLFKRPKLVRVKSLELPFEDIEWQCPDFPCPLFETKTAFRIDYR